MPARPHATGRWLALALWALLLAGLTQFPASRLQVGSDLSLFLPEPQTADERLLIEELQDGPATRLLFVALRAPVDDGSREEASESLADVSSAVAKRLRASGLFERVENGGLVPDERLQQLLVRYRYLLAPEGCGCDTAALAAGLRDRVDELASPAGLVAQDLLLRDPTATVEQIVDSWLPTDGPALRDGVWTTGDGRSALLMLQTWAAGFDADRQREAVALLEDAVSTEAPAYTLSVTGPGAFTVLIERTVRSDLTVLGTLAGVGSFAFLLWVLRSPRLVVLGMLTLGTATAAALLGVGLLAGSVHGITLAFGLTLLGVAMDYPVHLGMHLDGRDTAHLVREVWPTLRLSILTTCIAYVALAASGFAGLTQLGLFTVCGLAATAVIVRWLLPPLMAGCVTRDPPAWLARLDDIPRLPLVAPCVLVVALFGLALARDSLWNNGLAGFTPVPDELVQLDTRLRSALGAPDARYLLVHGAADGEAALVQDEALRAPLDALVQAGALAGFEQASRWLPSERRQAELRAALPDRTALEARVREVTAELPVRSEALSGFIADVEATRTLPPLRPGDLDGTAVGERIAALLRPAGTGGVASLILLSDVRDAARIDAWARGLETDVRLIDLQTLSESLVGRYRERALRALAVAIVVVTGLMWIQLSGQAALAIVLPVAATLAATAALLSFGGVQLTLFHLMSLLLVGGLSFDYGLFFRRGSDARTRYSVTVCWLSTAGAFGLLCLSELPVLRAIGSTVALGVTVGFVLALIGRQASSQAAAGPAHG